MIVLHGLLTAEMVTFLKHSLIHPELVHDDKEDSLNLV